MTGSLRRTRAEKQTDITTNWTRDDELSDYIPRPELMELLKRGKTGPTPDTGQRTAFA